MTAVNFSWDDLQFFLAVARSGQLSTAARQLRSSHATVARRIDRLEYALKVKLFERNPRGYVLTATGQRLMETAERMELETDRLQTDVAGGALTQRGTVRLSAPEGFSNFFLAHRLGAFSREQAGLTLELITIQQIMALSRKEADLAVVLDPPKAGPYHVEKLTDYRLQIYGARHYLEQHKTPKRREDLLHHRFIGYIQDMIFAPGLDYLGDIHPRIRPDLQSSSIFAQLTATRDGLGLCVLPIFIARQHADLVAVLADEVDLHRAYWIVVHRDLQGVQRVRAVADFLRQQVEGGKGLFTGAAGEGDDRP